MWRRGELFVKNYFGPRSVENREHTPSASVLYRNGDMMKAHDPSDHRGAAMSL